MFLPRVARRGRYPRGLRRSRSCQPTPLYIGAKSPSEIDFNPIGWRFLIAVSLAWLVWLAPAHAHQAGNSYLTLKVVGAQVNGRWDIALHDLEAAVGLDADHDGAITWSELQARQDAVVAYAFARLRISADGAACRLRFTDLLVDYHNDGTYAVLRFAVEPSGAARELEVEYHLLFDLDPRHRGLFRLEANGLGQASVFTVERPAQRFELGAPARGRSFFTFIGAGVWHIWTGFDHILFLLALLLPSVLRREGRQWRAADAWRPVLVNVVKIVTAFTLAHSLTLSLATLGVVELPSRWVESAIAASVLVAALNNLRPVFLAKGWWVAFGFGLVHGFGFAGALTGLGLPKGALAWALAGFNLGVELGQLVIVSLFLPVAYAVRHSWSYRRLLLGGGSAFIALLAAIWLGERLPKFKWLPF